MAHREEPVVIAGMRGPRQERSEQERQFKSEHSPVIPAQSDGTVYESRYRRYRVQVTPTQTVQTAPGRYEVVKGVSATFENYYWINREKDPEKRAETDKALQSNSWFGINKDFWLASEKRAAVDNKNLSAARDAIKRNPELLTQLLDELRASDPDFVLPQAEGSAE